MRIFDRLDFNILMGLIVTGIFINACSASDEEIKLACLKLEDSGDRTILEDVGLNAYHAKEVKILLDLVEKDDSRVYLVECMKAVKAMR